VPRASREASKLTAAGILSCLRESVGDV
jgi:hypothetical protein